MNSLPCVMIIAQGIYLQISGVPSFSRLQLIIAFNGKAIDKCLLPFFPMIINPGQNAEIKFKLFKKALFHTYCNMKYL